MTGKPYTPAERRELYARVAKISRRLISIREQAEALGLALTHLYNLRRAARKAGHNIPRQRVPPYTHRPRVGRWAAIDVEMATPPCDRCGLRGKHECLSTRVDPHARRAVEMP